MTAVAASGSQATLTDREYAKLLNTLQAHKQAPALELARWLGTIEHERPDQSRIVVVPVGRGWRWAQIARVRDGTVNFLRLELGEGVEIPVAALEATFGEVEEMTRVHWPSPTVLAFDHAEGGFACKVLAELARDQPKGTPPSIAAITLRRDGRV